MGHSYKLDTMDRTDWPIVHTNKPKRSVIVSPDKYTIIWNCFNKDYSRIPTSLSLAIRELSAFFVMLWFIAAIFFTSAVCQQENEDRYFSGKQAELNAAL